MRKQLGFALLAALVLASRSIECQSGPSTPDSVFRQLVVERIGVFARGDSSGYRAFLAADAIFLGEDGVRLTGAQAVDNASHRDSATYTVDSLQVTRAGDFALVDYRVVKHNTIGSRTFTSPFAALDTFIWREGRWLLLAHTRTHKINPAPPIVVDSITLQQYVGRYEWWPGFENIVTRRGNTLYQRDSNEKEATPVRAATPESFYTPGNPQLGVFVRDVHGKVTSFVLHEPDGEVDVARRLP